MFFEFGEYILSNLFVFLTLCEEVQLCFDLCVTVGAQPLLPGQPGLPASTCFYGQAVLTESVLRQGFSHFIVLHCGQVFCHSVFSV